MGIDDIIEQVMESGMEGLRGIPDFNPELEKSPDFQNILSHIRYIAKYAFCLGAMECSINPEIENEAFEYMEQQLNLIGVNILTGENKNE